MSAAPAPHRVAGHVVTTPDDAQRRLTDAIKADVPADILHDGERTFNDLRRAHGVRTPPVLCQRVQGMLNLLAARTALARHNAPGGAGART